MKSYKREKEQVKIPTPPVPPMTRTTLEEEEGAVLESLVKSELVVTSSWTA